MSFMDRARLDGRTVVIFGGSGGGMGTATSQALASAGANLVVFDITEERVEDARKDVAEVGGRCVGLVGDVRELSAVERAYALADEEFGALHGVVNLVGGTRVETKGGTAYNASPWNPLHEFSDEIWSEMFELNTDYVFRSCRLAARAMIARKTAGTIVNFASASAIAGAAYHGPYGAAKAAVMALTKTLAIELGPYGIRANCVVPGSVPAPLSKQASLKTFDSITDRASAKAPLGRRVAPEEIAGAVLFFSSELSGGVTGQCLNVDAGASANSPLGTGREYAESMATRHGESAR
ncbi:SDR family NAD(P)-dependent oxidoreductase [Nocardia salmonicida]|uniref:SDR family NAD(P)-dependent oxidoreductase n=1 Tax=Nocardia salmonicida TaxID=53431 RepID=UPI00366FD8EF